MSVEHKSNQSPVRNRDDWWRGAVIYQVYPRSYQDTTGNGLGDLPGITRRLPHIAELGVDAVWLSPFFTSPMKDMGYDVSDYCDVDPLFGTIDDFSRLVETAHAIGLKVIIDQVLSHTSDQHPWFIESRKSVNNAKADWYVWADAKPEGSPPTNWQSVFGGPAWTWNATRRQYYLHNFLASQPDLNFHNADVQDAVLDAVRFWLDLGVDGFRLDTVNYYFHDTGLRSNPPATDSGSDDVPQINPYGFQEHLYDKTQPENIAFLNRFRDLLDSYPGTTSVGEVGDGDRSLQTMAQYTAGNNRLHMCYSFVLLGKRFSKAHFEDTIRDFERASQEFADGTAWPCWAFSNHDVMRHVSRWANPGDDVDQLAKLSCGVLLSLPGSVCLYQGEELGLQEAELKFEDLTDPYGITFWPEFKGRDGCRTPMVWERQAPNGGFSSADRTWLPVTELHHAAAVDGQTSDPSSVLSFYRSFLAFRRARRSMIVGDMRFLDLGEQILAFLRSTKGETTLCIFNLSADTRTLDLPGDLKLVPLSVAGDNAWIDHGKATIDGHHAFFASVL